MNYEDLLYLNITRESGSAYHFILAHPDAVMMAVATGCESSIAGCIRAAFRETPVGEKIYAHLTMASADADEYSEAALPRPRRGGGCLIKGSGNPDYEKAASFLMSRLA